ncbi:MAG: hypothetical protein ABW019_05255 [Chitinophagaceae bacterium]
MPHNCGPARVAVHRCERAVSDLRTKISQNEEFLVSHPHDAAVQNRLRQLRTEYQAAQSQLNMAEEALANCEAQNEH